MITFKKSRAIIGTAKEICVVNGSFTDYETGEAIPLASMIEEVLGSEPFELKISHKTETTDNTED